MAVWALHIRLFVFELADISGRIRVFLRPFKGGFRFAAVCGVLDLVDEFSIMIDQVFHPVLLLSEIFRNTKKPEESIEFLPALYPALKSVPSCQRRYEVQAILQLVISATRMFAGCFYLPAFFLSLNFKSIIKTEDCYYMKPSDIVGVRAVS